MKIARYWAIERLESRTPKGKPVLLGVWEWSESSLQEARERARASVRRLARRVEANGFDWREHSRTYGYEDKPPREEIVEEIRDANGEISATITRNAYGALVLNTPRLMFIDVDAAQPSCLTSLLNSFLRFMGRSAETSHSIQEQKLRQLSEQNPAWGLRIYRTAAGFRCIVTGRSFDPASPQAVELFTLFGTDPLYVRLCKDQQCYRARLSPKFWRVGGTAPPNRFPWDSHSEEQLYRRWQNEYDIRSGNFAVCRLISESPSRIHDAAIESLLRLHDRYTKAESDLQLA